MFIPPTARVTAVPEPFTSRLEQRIKDSELCLTDDEAALILAVLRQARPLSRLPYPMSFLERTVWLSHQTRLRGALDALDAGGKDDG